MRNQLTGRSDTTYTSSIEPERPPVNIQTTRSCMPVNDAGGHAWQTLRLSIRNEVIPVTNAAVHHLIIAFRPRGALLVPSARLVSLERAR